MKKNLVIGSIVVSSLVQFTSPAQASRESDSRVVGAIIGGIIGSQIGEGQGKKAATIIGTIAGAIMGGDVGRDLDREDRRAVEDCHSRAIRGELNRREEWNGRDFGSRSGARGSIVATREGIHLRTNERCREYVSEVYVYGRREETRGFSCVRRDGSSYDVRETEVDFRRGFGRDERVRPPRYPDNPNRPLPPLPPPVRSEYEGSVRVDQITRKTGGEWIRVSLYTPVSLQRLEVQLLSAGLKIHEASLYTESGRRISIRELSPTPTFYAGSRAVSENLNLGRERVQVIDIRAESMGGYASVVVKAISDEATPSLSASRY